ncbi:unnamed protein product [Rotaria sp. Silwood1]|nr:unnamed protein product [Rotaria sp. Silwood1]CAF4998909.1 unnamed protein product [Rotaria sp. Silwood1]
MATGNLETKSCCKCDKKGQTFTCNGCQQTFCSDHLDEHLTNFFQRRQYIEQEHNDLKQDLSQQTISKTLLVKIDQWEKESIEKIQDAAGIARTTLNQFSKELNDLINKLSNELYSSPQKSDYSENDLDQWMKQLEELRMNFGKLSKIEVSDDDFSSVPLIKIKIPDEKENNQTDSKFSDTDRSDDKSTEVVMSSASSTDDNSTIRSSHIHSQPKAYHSDLFGLSQLRDKKIQSLLEDLMYLDPMEKNGPMSGQCGLQTDQMERFLSTVFGFKNIPDTYIVQGVKSFKLDKSLHSLKPNEEIHFPTTTKNSFIMTVQEIIDWQRSYKVYADKTINGMDQKFLQRALQGQSQDGEEAFRMKYVVRISTCPILMEFDAKIISRRLDEEWPSRIKLVSATGIDFAGRKHDVDDIVQYVSNWKDVFFTNRQSDLPLLFNERDFHRKPNRSRGQLHEERVRNSLIRMTRLRLCACDAEEVQIVIETGIGLGVFAGSPIGIDAKIRALSAEAIRIVLEQDGASYKNIRAIVFALPILNENKYVDRPLDAFNDFVNEFRKSKYTGPIPVMIVDQDMHRLAVAIARRGFIVSELNPGDSHSIFGEYWQNRGPSVEEKLALTTIGLLVQHHLINPCVLDINNYHLLELNEGSILDRRVIKSSDNE